MVKCAMHRLWNAFFNREVLNANILTAGRGGRNIATKKSLQCVCTKRNDILP